MIKSYKKSNKILKFLKEYKKALFLPSIIGISIAAFISCTFFYFGVLNNFRNVYCESIASISSSPKPDKMNYVKSWGKYIPYDKKLHFDKKEFFVVYEGKNIHDANWKDGSGPDLCKLKLKEILLPMFFKTAFSILPFCLLITGPMLLFKLADKKYNPHYKQ